jgi:thiosulfate reductase cytochrome b subunit
MVRFTYRKLVSWTLLVLTLLFLISGFGITEPWLVRSLTFGLFDKALSQQIHFLLWGPFLIVLVLHIHYSCGIFRR